MTTEQKQAVLEFVDRVNVRAATAEAKDKNCNKSTMKHHWEAWHKEIAAIRK